MADNEFMTMAGAFFQLNIDQSVNFDWECFLSFPFLSLSLSLSPAEMSVFIELIRVCCISRIN